MTEQLSRPSLPRGGPRADRAGGFLLLAGVLGVCTALLLSFAFVSALATMDMDGGGSGGGWSLLSAVVLGVAALTSAGYGLALRRGSGTSTPTSTGANTSLFLGVLALLLASTGILSFLGLLVGVPAVIAGLTSSIGARRGRSTGLGRAILGTIAGTIAVLVWLAIVTTG
jgi:hypothetical protein